MSKQLTLGEEMTDNFEPFAQTIEANIQSMGDLYVTCVDKDTLWATYLSSFPEGTNPIYRERTEHDCSCCRQFIRAFGNVVSIIDGEVVTIWGGDHPAPYNSVAKAMNYSVLSHRICDVFITKDRSFGCRENHEPGDIVLTFHHFFARLPSSKVYSGDKSVGDIMGGLRDSRNVFKRGMDEITPDAVESVLDLISQKSLYKGEEWLQPLVLFAKMQAQYLSVVDKESFAWDISRHLPQALSKIRNHSIGVLLQDVSAGMDLDTAVKRYENIVAPTNYKRPKAIFTKKMLVEAEAKVVELGYMDSLPRRHATIEDITINDILFANRDAAKAMGSVFDEMATEVPANVQSFDRVDTVSIEDFVNDVLPRATKVSVLLENKHSPNLMTLIAPSQPSPSMFKWDNGFSWAYNGNITDSAIKQNVKLAGGNVGGVLRFSIQWNTGERDGNDLDAHCMEPKNSLISFQRMESQSSGVLDVDIQYPRLNIPAVENIVWTDINRMPDGIYQMRVHNFAHRGGRSGFEAEIEFDRQVFNYVHNKEVCGDESVPVATVTKQGNQFSIVHSIDSATSNKEMWGITTNQFVPVSVCMFSPNYWVGNNIGNKHYFFMLKDCINDTRPNGFFNEFLKDELITHKRVFEALGGKMKVEDAESQLSGLGFSSTQRNEIIVKVEGSVARTVKVLF